MNGKRTSTAAAFLAILLGAAGGIANAQEAPLSVTYGLRAPTAEGDPAHRNIFFISLPATLADRVYLRIFDPDVGGEHDLVYGAGFDSETRFVLFGGEGARTAADPGGWLEPTPEQLEAGTVLVDRRFGESAAHDGKWTTLAALDPGQGETVDGRTLFRLVVHGTAGNDANLYSVTMSLRDGRNVLPDGLEVTSFDPALRVPDDSRLTEMRFTVPEDAARLVLRNFDLAGGESQLVTRLRSVPLASSGQDEWAESEVPVDAAERGQIAAVTFAGGEEMPNDGTFQILADGVPVPILLPARTWLPNQRPLPAATITPLASCLSVAFDAGASSDPDGNRLGFTWAFGDGASAGGPVVVHRYPGPGTYRATLEVTDSSGQVGNGAAASFDVFVKRPPTAVVRDLPVVAPGEPIRLDGSGSLDGDRPITRHSWLFQDGTTADGAVVDHVLAQPGRYLATLRVEDDSGPPCDFATDETVVVVNAAPVAVAGVDRRVAVGDTVRLDAGRSFDSDGEIVDHVWDLGDGAELSGPLVEHRYAAPGSYTVRLTVRDDAGVANSAAQDTATVAVNAPPVAEAGDDRTVAIGEVITFDGRGSSDQDGSIIRYSWDLGDGARGSGAVVEYAYPQPGDYRVTLTVQDDSGTASSTALDWLTVTVNAPPVADAGPDQHVTESEVRFDGTGSTAPGSRIASYAWDFGDGNSGAGPTPAHVYAAPGTYLVRLVVTDDSGTVRNTATDTMRVVVNAMPIADAGPDQIGAPGQTLTFQGTGSIDPDGDVVAHHWDFQDGTTASGAVVRHAFAAPGVYHVRLTVQDDTGHEAAIDVDEAEVVINAPPVAVAGADLRAAPGQEVRFDARNAFDPDGELVTYRWDFSDVPEPVLEPVVVRGYDQPGVYTVQLTVTDDSGALNAVAKDSRTIAINHAPVAAAGSDIRSDDSTITLDGSASADADGDVLTYRWDLGDGSPPRSGARVTHTYAQGGLYPVVLSVDDGTGLANATATAGLVVTIDRPPVAVAGMNKTACSGDLVVFDGSASYDPDGGLLRYHWDFGDGTSATIVNPTKTYRAGGLYTVALTVEDESGFPGNRHTDRLIVRVDESPIANAGQDQQVCTGADVHFDGSGSWDSDGVVNRFLWDFGDGRIGSGERPVHVFAEPARYRVLLTIEGDDAGQCDNTHTDEVLIDVAEAPVARITAATRVAAGVATTFDGSGSTSAEGRIVGWHWDFGDGTTGQGRVVRHRYETPGSYTATLTIATEGSSAACDAIAARHPLIVNAPPVAVAGTDRLVGIDELVTFDGSASTDPDGAIASYEWQFGDGSSAGGMLVRHRFGASGSYPVTLTVRDDAGLANSVATATLTVAVNATAEPVIEAPPVACVGETLAFAAAGSQEADGAVERYLWSFADGGTAEGPAVTHSFAQPGRYQVTLVTDDGRGLNNSRSQTVLSLHVNRPPAAAAGPDRTVCPGDPVTFDGSASLDWDGRIVEHLWAFGDGKLAAGESLVHEFLAPGLYQVRLTVTDDSGSACAAATDVARVRVVRPPVAVAGGDLEGFVGGANDRLRLDASGSSHPDGRPLTYRWEVDGVTLAGEQVLHAFAAPGEHAVRLTVSDDTGLACGAAVDEVTVTVRPR